MRKHIPSPARRPVAGLVALAVLAAVAFAAWLAERPPAPLGEDAPAAQFSATRAWPHLEKIAGGGPTPVGSPGGDRIRDYLVGRLAALGLEPEVQTGVGARSFGSAIVSGLTENVVARIPGAAATGQVVLAAHYDSTTTTPGTSDDKASVAAILEIVRALQTGGERPRNDLVILLSDGEEPGLIGAESFAAHHPLARSGGVVINLEGPGNGAPSAVYNVTPGGTGLTGVLAASPYPVGESALIGIYRQTGFHSDLTTLEEHGFIGVDLGTAGGRAYYHHPRDTLANFEPAVLQMHGANGLALTRAALAADLPRLREPSDAAFFSAFGAVVRIPGALILPLAVLGALVVLAFAVLARVRRAASLPGMGLAVLTAAVPAGLAYLAGDRLWPLLGLLRPGYAGMVYGEPYRPDLYRLALIALALALVWGWFVLLRRRFGPVALSVGALAWLAVAGVGLAGVMPGMFYYGALPALAGGLAGIAALFLNGPRPARGSALLALAVQTAAAVVGVVLLTAGARTFAAFGLALAATAMVLLVLAAFAALPVLAAATPGASGASDPGASGPGASGLGASGLGASGLGASDAARSLQGRLRAASGPVGAAVLAVALAAAGLVYDRFDEQHPEAAHLAYVLDGGSGQAHWVSADERLHPWAAGLTPEVPGSWALPLPFGMSPAHAGKAVAAELPAPEVRVLSRRQEGAETVTRVRVRSLRGAYQLNLHADRPARAGSIRVDGRPGVPLPQPEEGPGEGEWPFEAQFFAPPGAGVEFELRTSGAPALLATDITLGLDGLDGYRPRPATVDLSSSTGGLPTDSVVVVGRIRAP
ncbi:M20/M25/M40 family metallo-hydrolase [Nonomuraea typhae]|uniref:M20/M25/M40 family metallo-hydrolase n=1 Tax=Nonomuraea typhae TaxID=2603600 RepID=UPI0012F7426A|nr:M20/M25/M40 family metallo-hydrolase [Nonomuraea typhae]